MFDCLFIQDRNGKLVKQCIIYVICYSFDICRGISICFHWTLYPFFWSILPNSYYLYLLYVSNSKVTFHCISMRLGCWILIFSYICLYFVSSGICVIRLLISFCIIRGSIKLTEVTVSDKLESFRAKQEVCFFLFQWHFF